MDKVLLGSQAAKSGFSNERDIAKKFEAWKKDLEAQNWLVIMGYKLKEIEFVKAVVVTRQKADINVQIMVKLKQAIDVENLQVKLVSNNAGFNQIDKRWVKNYVELWNIPTDIEVLLKHFTGELPPKIASTKDNRRMFVTEFSEAEQQMLLDFFKANKSLILNDIIRGRGQFSADWVLVAQKVKENARWVLQPMNKVINHYDGEVKISPQGSINIGRVGVQRKGGDGGRATANMLQFKVDPTELFYLE